jgi:heme exporter protein A
MNKYSLTGKDLSCERGGRTVFSKLNFNVAEGELLELRGANGSGKSSLLRLIAGLVAPREGQVNCTPEQCHYIGHADTNKPALSVLENVKFWAAYFGEAEVETALNHFNLQSLRDDQTYLLSAGQKRRLTLTRLALAKRKIWLLDEPMVGLDFNSQQNLLMLMTSHLAQDGIILAATHTELGLKSAQTLQLDAR